MRGPERKPGAPVWQVTADQLARGFMRKHADGRVTGPHAYTVLAKLDDGTFEVEGPPGDVEEAPEP